MDGLSESRGRLLDAAEALFIRKGYGATTLRDISTELGVSHASLYYHFPGGKDELFVAVTERNIERHRLGLIEAIQSGGDTLHGRLTQVASWLLSQPPMDLIRMAETDMPALPQATARKLMEALYASILWPITGIFREAKISGTVSKANDEGLLAGAFFGLIESLHATPSAYVSRGKMDMANELIGIVLKGIGYTEGE